MRNFLALLIVCLFVSAALAKRSKKEKKAILLHELEEEKERAEKLAEEVKALDEDEDEDEEDEEDDETEETNENEQTKTLFDEDEEEDEIEDEDVKPVPGRNPCETKKCGRGMNCVLVKNQAVCECVSTCRRQDARHNVCSKGNETFETECELDRQFCLCSHDLEGCTDPKYKKVRLDYYGACKKLPECLPKQLKEFRVRVQEWLLRVMKDLKTRKQLDDYEIWLDAAKKEKNHEHAVVWRFCQLDNKPRDTYMSRRELQFTIHSLKGMEQCLVPFLSDCDKNADRKISLEEWEMCLNLNKDQVPKHCLPLMD